MTPPTLVAVAHGSTDPAAQRTVRELLAAVRDLVDVPVTEAYVQNAAPGLDAVLDSTGPDAVVVPLLLSRGYHLFVDVADAAARVGARVTAPLGPDPALAVALADRLAQAGAPADVPVVLAAAGSSDARAIADVRTQAALLHAHRQAAVIPAYASAATPTVDQAAAQLYTQTGQPVAVASYLLAPGTFHDRLARCAVTWVADPLGAHPAVASVVAERYRNTAGAQGASTGAHPGRRPPDLPLHFAG